MEDLNLFHNCFNWCANSHANFHYEGMYLLVAAIVALIVFYVLSKYIDVKEKHIKYVECLLLFGIVMIAAFFVFNMVEREEQVSRAVSDWTEIVGEDAVMLPPDTGAVIIEPDLGEDSTLEALT